MQREDIPSISISSFVTAGKVSSKSSATKLRSLVIALYNYNYMYMYVHL